MDANPVLTLVEYAALALAPLLMVISIRHLPGFLVRTRVVLVRLHLWGHPPARPAGPPLEQLAADLRRLYVRTHAPPPGARMPKQRGVQMAYDQRLVETARALDVSTSLDELPIEGFDRDAERLRLEHELVQAGMVWQAQQGWQDPAA